MSPTALSQSWTSNRRGPCREVISKRSPTLRGRSGRQSIPIVRRLGASARRRSGSRKPRRVARAIAYPLGSGELALGVKRLLGNYVDTTALDTIAASLPFDFYPGAIALPLPERLGGSTSGTMSILPSMADLLRDLDVEALRAAPFEQAALLTADGRTVRERRHTAWLAEEGIGALAYSGKLMNPSPLDACEAVRSLRDGLHKDCGERFDCALANLYVEGGQAACAWHRDPEHGDEIDLRAKWARPTYVVSAGETRRFAFRPYRQPGEPPAAEDERHAIALFSGDVIAMGGDCNDLYEHCVLPGQGDKNEGARVSLVFKRALVGRDGKRGHTLEGQGRRAERRGAPRQRGGGGASAEAQARLSTWAGWWSWRRQRAPRCRVQK